jgi:hypothetical protein
MPYVPLGARPLTATADTTGRNTGNWTNWYTPAILNTQIPYFEIYHLLFTGARVLDTVTIWVGTFQWSFATAGPGGGSEWDPVSPMLLRPSDEVFFFWSTPASVPNVPVVTAWLRFSTGIPANKPYAGAS